MYFKSRTEAGKLLAADLAREYEGLPCAVVAVSEGGVMVGLQIAEALQCTLSLLLVEAIDVPGLTDSIGSISENGSFTFSNMYSPGVIEELMFDYRGFVEEEKRSKLSELHHITGSGNTLRIEMLRGRHIILAGDGFSTGYSLDIAMEVLKPVAMRSLSAAAPVVSPTAVDRIRVLCDRIYYLDVAQNYLATDHYYEVNDVPERDKIMKVIQDMADQWEDDAAGNQDAEVGEYIGGTEEAEAYR